MALTPEELAALARAEDYNGNRYDASTNPYGLAGLGYRTNWPSGLNDTAILTNATAREAGDAADSAAAVAAAAIAADASADAAAASAAAADASADAAAQSAADAAAAAGSVNLPPISAGEYLRGNSAGDGWETLSPSEVAADIGAVTSVNGQTGVVTLTAGDFGVSPVPPAISLMLL